MKNGFRINTASWPAPGVTELHADTTNVVTITMGATAAASIRLIIDPSSRMGATPDSVTIPELLVFRR
jgi:hypothetical protein